MIQLLSNFLIQVFYDFLIQRNLPMQGNENLTIHKEKEVNPLVDQQYLIDFQSESIRQMRLNSRIDKKISDRTVNSLTKYIMIQSTFLTVICIFLILILWIR